MGIKKDAFLRDMVRVVVAFEDVIQLWIGLFNKFGENDKEAFKFISDNKDKYQKLLVDVVPRVDALSEKSMLNVIQEFNKFYKESEELINKGMRAPFGETEVGDMFVREFQKVFKRVQLTEEDKTFLRSVAGEVQVIPDEDIADKVHVYFNAKEFPGRYKAYYARYKRGDFAVPSNVPERNPIQTPQQKQDIINPGAIRTAGVSHRRVILQYLNSLDQR